MAEGYTLFCATAYRKEIAKNCGTAHFCVVASTIGPAAGWGCVVLSLMGLAIADFFPQAMRTK